MTRVNRTTGLTGDTFAVNIYDLFANFLPGIVFVGGILLPFFGSRVVEEITLFQGTFITLLAFAIGVGIQAIGTRLKRPRLRRIPYLHTGALKVVKGWGVILLETTPTRFNDRMNDLFDGGNSAGDAARPEDVEMSLAPPDGGGLGGVLTPYPDESIPETNFSEACKQVFGFDRPLTEFNDDWDFLYKMILSYLEGSPCDRTIRIQAQYCATRGLFYTSVLLSIYYVAMLTTLLAIETDLVGVLSSGSLDGLGELLRTGFATSSVEIVPAYVLLTLSVLGLLFSGLFYVRARHFEEDIVNYMISEIIISAELDERG